MIDYLSNQSNHCKTYETLVNMGFSGDCFRVRFSHPLLETFENEGFCASSSSRVITRVIKEISYESIKLDSMIFFYLPKTELSRILIFIRRKKILDSSYTDYFS